MRKRLITPPNELISALLRTPFRPEFFTLNGVRIPYMRLEVPFPVEDLFEWLSAQNLFPKVYFETELDGAIAAIGSVFQTNEIPTFSEETGPRLFGGRDFMKRRKNSWKSFPDCSYFLPLIEIEKRKEGTFLCINRTEENLDFTLEPPLPLEGSFSPISRFDSPSYPVWEREIGDILKGINRNEYLKVVLARCTKLEGEGHCSPYALLKNLSGNHRFAFQFSEKEAFISSTPEMLYRRVGDHVQCAAIAGTSPRGSTPEKDAFFKDQLLNCPKERHELDVVKDMIVKTLSPLCLSVSISECTTLQTTYVHHLHHLIEGTLQPGVTDHMLVDALHPTPAVGGFPKVETCREINKREHFDRGWYAAPIGFVSPEKAHHMVAIRSALVEENTLRLYAGTGIVKGSTPIREWEELEHKISQYMAFYEK
ncbi:MAG: isochorismate synthase [Chlamydiia bacterium]|nr:isochorismate synthase [Chlamydiia bacterium]